MGDELGDYIAQLDSIVSGKRCIRVLLADLNCALHAATPDDHIGAALTCRGATQRQHPGSGTTTNNTDDDSGQHAIRRRVKRMLRGLDMLALNTRVLVGERR